MSGIPPVVPKTLRAKVESIQEQLKILLHNYKVLSIRHQENPEDDTVNEQLCQVKEYIVLFNQEQCNLFEKIRQFLKDLETGVFFERKRKVASSYDATLEEKDVEKNENTTTANQNAAHTLQDRSINATEDESEELYVGYFCKEDFYRGHVEHYQVECPDKLEKVEIAGSSPTKKYRLREEIDSTNQDKTKHMLNIELMPGGVLEEYMTTLSEVRAKLKYREFLSVPEVSDKKYRNQSFLQKMAVSPPQLRKRRPENTINKPSRPVRAITFPPERMGTRKQNSIKRRHETEEQKEIEKLRKLDPDVEEEKNN